MAQACAPRLAHAVLLLLLPFVSAATDDGGRHDALTTPPACDAWVASELSANVTEGVRWEFGWPDFTNRARRRVALYTCSSGLQRSVRIGPFASRAGGSYDITSDIIELFDVGDRITTFWASPVSRSGPIGYPPLYVHHIHVGRLSSFYDEHWFTTHGDYSVGDDFGIGAHSTKGYTTFLPPGHCFAVDCRLPFAVQAIIQDLRSISSAPQLEVFIEVTFGLAHHDAAIEPASLIWNEAPHGPFGYSRFAVLDKPSMSWWTMSWPQSGILLPNAKLHSHYARHHRLFLIDGAPQKLAFLESHVKEIVHVHDSVPPTSAHETMILVNLSHTEQTFSQLPSTICQDDGNSPSFIVAATRDHPNASLWARRRDLICKPQALRKGHISTFVQLYRPIAEPDVRPYPMHTNTWFYVRMPGAASSSDIKAVSYRYATPRTTSLLQPLQDEGYGNCSAKPSAADVAAYVANNNKALKSAVEARRAAMAAAKAATNLVGQAEDKRTRGSTGVVLFLFSVGVLPLRALRTHTSALL